MCDKCKTHSRHWIHIADEWTKEEQQEMLLYLLETLPYVPLWHWYNSLLYNLKCWYYDHIKEKTFNLKR